MMLNNTVSVNKSIEKEKGGELNADIGASFSLDFLKLLKGEANVGAETLPRKSNVCCIDAFVPRISSHKTMSKDSSLSFRWIIYDSATIGM